MMVLMVLLISLCYLSLLEAYTSPRIKRTGSAMRLGLSSLDDIGSKANNMLKKKKMKEIDSLKNEMASEGGNHPINVSTVSP